MDWDTPETEQRRFHTRWRGLDPREVELHISELLEQIRDLKVQNGGLRKTAQDMERELKEFKEREKAIRNVLMTAHKAADQLKANAEKEARLIVSEAELKAEKLIHESEEKAARMQTDISDLKRYRAQFEARIRATIETYQKLLDMQREDDSLADA